MAQRLRLYTLEEGKSTTFVSQLSLLKRVFKEWRQLLTGQRLEFVSQSPSVGISGSLFFLTEPLFDIFDIKNVSVVKVFLSLRLHFFLLVRQSAATDDRNSSVCVSLYMCVCVSDGALRMILLKFMMTKWQTEMTTQPIRTKIYTQAVCSFDTAAISYHLSRLTAGEKETDGKRDW